MREDEAMAPTARRSRFWLFAPFLVLGLAGVAWTAAWFIVRAETRDALDGWLADEALAGRRWECADRSVGGYPFRIEITCLQLALTRGGWRATLGAMTVLTQVYQPRHVIAVIEGPFRATDGRIAVDASWQNLRASIRILDDPFQRASIVADAPVLKVTGLPSGELATASRRLEAHLRPHPSRWASEGALELSARSSQAVLPMLNEVVGGIEPADIDLQLTASQVQDVRFRSLADDLERWRRDGGKLELLLLSLEKGPRRLAAKGEAMLDELHRPAGRFEVSAAGVDGLLGIVAGSRVGGPAGAVLGSLLGQPSRQAQEPAHGGTELALQRLPPLRLDKGRVYFGPVAIPGVRLPALY